MCEHLDGRLGSDIIELMAKGKEKELQETTRDDESVDPKN